MLFSQIVLRNTRIIEHASIQPCQGLNYLVGANGSGKSSFLEGIHILSTGSSFRTRKTANLISHQCNALQSYAEFSYRKDKEPHSIGIERKRNGETRIKIDRNPTNKLAELSQTIPLLALHPESHQLLNSGPSLRRKLIDWGVFHVEPDFIGTWKKYKRLLDQRNAALKQGDAGDTISTWDNALAQAGESLNIYRTNYIEALKPFLYVLFEKVGWGSDLSLLLRRGWNEQLSLQDDIERNFNRDRFTRTTNVGPHRAELQISFANEEVRHCFSRGQQKLLVYLIKMAQANHIYTVRKIHSVFLCDDLPSELDTERCEQISCMLVDAGYQVFATSVLHNKNEYKSLNCAVFHVEHGVIQQVV